MNNSTGSTSMGMMIPWLHFGNTDFLIFEAWQPSSHGAIAGACIGLFLFSILERCLASYRRSQELLWMAKASPMSSKGDCSSDKEDSVEIRGRGATLMRKRLVPPFVPSHDILRGVIQAIQSTFSYALMLAVMTFNGAYIISIIVGLGVGEILCGRIGRTR